MPTLSLRHAQCEAAFEVARRDLAVLEAIITLPEAAVIDMLAGRCQCDRGTAAEVLKMLRRRQAAVQRIEAERSARLAKPLSVQRGARTSGGPGYSVTQFRQATDAAEQYIRANVPNCTESHMAADALDAFAAFREEYGKKLGLEFPALEKLWEAVHKTLVARRVIPTETPEGGTTVAPPAEATPAAEADGHILDIEEALDEINRLPQLTADHVIDAWEGAQAMPRGKQRNLALQHVRELSKRLTAARLIARYAQRKLVIPATADYPAPRSVSLPEQPAAPGQGPEAPAPTPGLGGETSPPTVPRTPRTPEEKKDAVDEAVSDSGKSRQDKLLRDFRGVEVMLQDFVHSMYGITLSQERLGKLVESVIDKASDLAAEQTADVVKSLASPFLPK